MTWVKLDDGFFRNRKARLAGKDGRALFLAGLCHCTNALTDGHIGTYDLPIIAAEAEVKPSVAKQLVKVGLWLEVDDGWQVHDYMHYQRSATDVRAEREEGRKRAAESARRRKQSSGEASGEEHAKDERRNGAASPAQSSSSPLGGSSVNGSSSSNWAEHDDDDWAALIAKRRGARREADIGKVGNRRKWLATTTADVTNELRDDAERFLLSNPNATALDVADHLEPTPDSLRRRAEKAHHCERCEGSGLYEVEGGAMAQCDHRIAS